MAFIHSRQRRIAPTGKRSVVLAVGQRAFVNAASGTAGMVSLTDDHGVRGNDALRDGAEVEILGWRPRGANGTRYSVCDRSCGSNGWLAAEELRTTASRTTSEPAAPPSVTDPHRPFGSGR